VRASKLQLSSLADRAKFLFAIQEAGKIYRTIETAKGKGTFISEVSMDETDFRRHRQSC